MVEFAAEQLEQSQLQEITACEDGVVLGFYRFNALPKFKYLLFDLSRAFPFMLLLDENPWGKLKKTKPVSLFLSAHAKNQYFNSITISEDLGRVVFLNLGVGDHLTRVEFRAIPKQVNFIVSHGNKSISWEPVRELAKNTADYANAESEEDVRSIAFLTAQWQRLRVGANPGKGAEGAALSPYEKWVKNRQKDLQKKTKAAEAVEKQILDFKNEEWSEVGESLKTFGMKNIKPEWSLYVDFEKSVSENIVRCFEKAKAAKQKLSGAEQRLIDLRREITELNDTSEERYENYLESRQRSANKQEVRRVEGRLRKLNLDGGALAYLGKSAADNMALLRSSKPHDLWFHLKDYPSAHAVVHRGKNHQLPDSDIFKVGKWLVTEGLPKSQVQLGGKFAVVYVECRHVKPIKGDKMGRVTYHNSREILIAL